MAGNGNTKTAVGFETTAATGPNDVLGTCPVCDEPEFVAQEWQGGTVFRCVACGASWQYGLGYLRRVD